MEYEEETKSLVDEINKVKVSSIFRELFFN